MQFIAWVSGLLCNCLVRSTCAALALLFLVGACSAPDNSSVRVNSAVAKLDELADKALVGTGIPGLAIAVVYRDEVLYLKGLGVRATNRADPVNADTRFQLASVSKPIASTVVAALVGDGSLSWDAPISKLDPNFALSDPETTQQVTLRDLFSHRSGLPSHAGDLLEDLGFSRTEILYRLRYLPPQYPFRAGYGYTNFGLTEAAIAAAMATGMAWEDLSYRRLYQPLGMTSTSSRYPDYVLAANRALGHVKQDGRYVPRYERNAGAQSPAGGVNSTARDLTQWMRLQLGLGMFDNRRIVAETPLRETWKAQVVSAEADSNPSGRSSFYGLGWGTANNENGLQIRHSGAFTLGFATVVMLAPDQQLGIAVLSNAEPTGMPEAIANTFMDLALKGNLDADWFAVYGNGFAALMQSLQRGPTDYTVPIAHPAPARPESSYSGSYTNRYYGDIRIAEENGKLFLTIGPSAVVELM